MRRPAVVRPNIAGTLGREDVRSRVEPDRLVEVHDRALEHRFRVQPLQQELVEKQDRVELPRSTTHVNAVMRVRHLIQHELGIGKLDPVVGRKRLFPVPTQELEALQRPAEGDVVARAEERP